MSSPPRTVLLNRELIRIVANLEHTAIENEVASYLRSNADRPTRIWWQ
ncbi:MAG: hypothetical protein R3C03_16260 [Pirellulaceae bacterium]